MHLWCEGNQTPTVVVLPCLGGAGIEWAGVQRALQQETAVCLVDRAGLGWSDRSPWPRTMDRMADEVITALDRSGLQPPFVMVGHSTGGLLARLVAVRFRDKVAALVLVDSSHEDQNHRFPKSLADSLYWRAIRARFRPLGIRRVAVDLGLDRQHERVGSEIPVDPVDTYVALYLTARDRRASVQELIGFARDNPHLRNEARRLGDLPVTMITAGPKRRESRWDKDGSTWLELQDDLAGLSSRTTRVFAEHAGHHVHHDDPDLVARVIRDVVDQVRAGGVEPG
ncbi:MAG: alpha/beta fold hydrolase [Haloechinothrix sp.]